MSGQNFLNVHELTLVRDTPGNTSGGRENNNVTSLLNGMGVLEVEIDATAGDLDDVLTIPAGSVVRWATLHVTEAFAGGTSVEIGTGADPDAFISVTTPSANAINVGAGNLVNTAFSSNEGVDVEVTGTYTTGKAWLKIVYQDVREIRSTGVNTTGGSRSKTLGY